MTLLIPYAVSDAMDPLQQCGLRVACFFYACKVLDLALRADRPPTRMVQAENGERQPAGMKSGWDYLAYAWLLLTEMRYHSFDIAVHQKNRPKPSIAGHSKKQLAWTIGPLTILPVLAYLVPTPETATATLLLLLQYGLGFVHFALHPRCPYPLFYSPFSAATMSDFWTTHWHPSASPFLQSLAYKPVRRITGSRACGVLAAFCLSGIWHGWAAAPLATRPWLVGLQVCGLFVSFGIACLAERWIWEENQGGMVQRTCVWAYALGWAGVCWRTLQRDSRIEWLRAGL